MMADKPAIWLPFFAPLFVGYKSMDWFKENLQETIDFPIKYGVFLYIFP